MIVNFDAGKLLKWDNQDISEQKNPQKNWNETFPNAEQAIKVDISKEGMDAYKKLYQRDEREYSGDGLNICFTSDGLVFGNKGWPKIEDFIDLGKGPGYMLKKGLSSDWYDDWTSVKDKASMLISAYARAYDEIVRGYEDGTRVKYRINNDSHDIPLMGCEDDLYRVVTREEELKALTDSFEARAYNLQELNEMSSFARKHIASQYTEWAKRGFIVTKEEAENVNARYLELKEEENIGNIKDKMMQAMELFQRQYAQTGLHNIITNVLD